MSNLDSHSIPAIRVRQWLPAWDGLDFDSEQNQAKPEPYFYLFSLSAAELKKLSETYRRDTSTDTPRKDDLGIQRRHDPERSAEIQRYVSEGYPHSTLSSAQRTSGQYDHLRKPGWLPTAIVVNILEAGSERNGRKLAPENSIRIEDDGQDTFAQLILPGSVDESLPPMEVIDGQHRLFAFDNVDDSLNQYELPVVAFHGLDISWQAYLFWTINIKPKKINPSLAFDLYPLLREQQWLESGDHILVYRESRAQELTEVLWAAPESPWFHRINMLGGPKNENGPVTQGAFVRSLMASLVKPWNPTGTQRQGGIFGGTPNKNEGLAWSRVQQAAFLLTAWKLLANKIRSSQANWAEALRDDDRVLDGTSEEDPAFCGRNSLLASDQGVRGFQQVINDIAYAQHQRLQLSSWRDQGDISDMSPENISRVANTIPEQIRDFLESITEELARFDWRTSNARGLTDTQRLMKAALRGSGGYKEIRSQLIDHISRSGDQDLATTARLMRV